MAAKLNLKINQGETYRHKLYLSDPSDVPINLTGYTARMHIRENIKSEVVLLELTTENGGIILSDLLGGELSLYISSTGTSAITWAQGVYDLEVIAPGIDGDVTRLIEGNVAVSKEVTR